MLICGTSDLCIFLPPFLLNFTSTFCSNNENKPVTNSRDTQEVFLDPGREVLRIFTTFTSKTSILDDFSFYDQRQEQMKEKKGKLEV
jgi:hypothetical protein